jgi:hypothetical protein
MLQWLIMVLPQLIPGQVNNGVQRLNLVPSLLHLLVLSGVLLQVSLSCCALTVLLQSLLNFISNV